ncbi:MAG: ATP-dependent Clp protease proteolytic subunit [Rhizobiaceae bacterium]|nr:ATP-dependent Clp protease proteolytic subunit [Rhizobiaceae bacterium]
MKPISSDTLGALQHCALSALNNGATEMTIYLSCEGGTNDQGFAAYNFLRSLPVPLTMHGISNVESMAVILFLAADRRVIVPHGKVKIHPMHWGFNGGPVDHDRLAEYVESMDFDAKRYANIFAERTPKAKTPLNIAENLAGRALVLDAKAAVESNIATEIADAAIPADSVRWWV